MHSENIAVYVGLDVHKETLAVAIANRQTLCWKALDRKTPNLVS